MYRRVLPLACVVALVAALSAGCSQEATDTQEEDKATSEPVGEMALTSSAFAEGGAIPTRYCNVGVEGGENVSIPLDWSGQPADAKSYVLVMVDHHPVADEWVHWMVTSIPAETSSLVEGASGSSMPQGSRELLSTSGKGGYQGPEPPAGSGDHEYETRLFALDVDSIDVAEDATYAGFLAAVEPHVVGEAALSGFFGR